MYIYYRSPDGNSFVSSDLNGKIYLWKFDINNKNSILNLTSSKKQNEKPKELKGHRKHVGTLWWEPCHLNDGKCERFISGSKGT